MLKKIPHTYVIVFAIIVISAILTWVVPGGAFERHIVTVNGIDRNVVIPGSFNFTENNPQTWQVFSALFDGFVDKADIIIFILMIGGAFWIMNESKAIDVAIQSFLRFSKRIEHNRVIAKLGADNLIFILIMIMPSGSAKAALTMPMMSQFSDLIGVSRQATVMAFQFGDGFTNMITPTSGVLLGVLSVAKIPYDKWFRWVLPLIIILFILGFLLLIPTVYMELKGF